jgi:hypothetical protein
MRKSLVVASTVLMVSSLLVVGACGSSNKQAVVATTTPDAGSDAAADATAATPGPVATGPAFFTDAGTTTTTPVVTDQVVDAAIDLAITTASAKVAPKMAEEGQPGRATLKEGEHFAMVVTLQPNRCYTFVAFSPPGSISQLDMKLLGVAIAVEAGKSSPPDKATPGLSVMGKTTGAICPILPVPVPYKVDVVATKGAGRMGVKVFARNK